MILRRLLIITLFLLITAAQNAFCADSLRVKDIVIDNSDRMVLIKTEGSYKTDKTSTYTPSASKANTSVNLINDITTFTISSPSRYVVDIPNATLTGANRTYKFKNSSVIQSVALAQFSTNPNIVRAAFTLINPSDISKFSTYADGSNIIIKYSGSIIDNSLQYKFYTPQGDMDKGANPQITGATVNYNDGEEREIIPRLRTKYYLSQVSQNSDGLILRGLGSISYQRANYDPDNISASLVLDNASMASKLENKTYRIPSSQKDIKATLTINKLSPKKIKLTLNGENIRDYRFVISPDGQSLFISHRSFIINTTFSTNTASVKSYKLSKTQNGYKLIDIAFSKGVTYDVFELNDNFYIDINNLGDYNLALFEQMQKTTDTKITAIKISNDKTRFVIPSQDMNFAYANVESNAKSIKLCFKEKPQGEKTASEQVSIPDKKDENKKTEGIIIAISDIEKAIEDAKKDAKDENINVYVPKNEEIEKPKKNKDSESTIKSMKKVVIDPGHGGADSGAIGGSLYEKTLNLEVAKLVAQKLGKKNIYVYMTRQKDTTLTLEDRVNYSNEINPDIYVSIHTNSTVQSDSFGLETHYYKDDSYDLAQIIHGHFASEKNVKKWESKDRGVIKSRFYVINHTEAPSVLIEMGFISNMEERVKLQTKQRQEEIAASIAEGILEYLKVK